MPHTTETISSGSYLKWCACNPQRGGAYIAVTKPPCPCPTHQRQCPADLLQRHHSTLWRYRTNHQL